MIAAFVYLREGYLDLTPNDSLDHIDYSILVLPMVSNPSSLSVAQLIDRSAIDPDNVSHYGSVILTNDDMRSMFIPKLATERTQLTFIIRHGFARLFHFKHKQVIFIRATFMDNDVWKNSSCPQLTI